MTSTQKWNHSLSPHQEPRNEPPTCPIADVVRAAQRKAREDIEAPLRAKLEAAEDAVKYAKIAVASGTCEGHPDGADCRRFTVHEEVLQRAQKQEASLEALRVAAQPALEILRVLVSSDDGQGSPPDIGNPPDMMETIRTLEAALSSLTTTEAPE